MGDNLSQPKKKHSTLCENIWIIGLVGDVAGGKSTVARRLATLGAGWIDADQLAHRCLSLPSVRKLLSSHFGPEALNMAGQIDRAALARIVFGANAESDERLQYLEHVLHPVTRELAIRRMKRWEAKGVNVIVLDAPLLLEASWDVLCDDVWCVSAPRILRLKWAGQRGWSAAELSARELKQHSTAHKQQRSTVLIDNRSDRETLLHTIDQLFKHRINQSTHPSNQP